MSDSKYAIRPNKTQLKREIKALNKLGQELIALPDGALKKVPLSEQMRQAIHDGQRFSRGALQRQLRRIANLMQHEDIDAIELELARQKQPSKQQTAEFHQLEDWRDRLIAGDEALFAQLLEQFSAFDRQYVRQLMRNAKQEKLKSKPPKSARLLFRYLTELKKVSPTDQSDHEQEIERE